MKAFYRISPFLSSNPNPLGRDKEVINFKCLMSFLEANRGFAQITFKRLPKNIYNKIYIRRIDNNSRCCLVRPDTTNREDRALSPLKSLK